VIIFGQNQNQSSIPKNIQSPTAIMGNDSKEQGGPWPCRKDMYCDAINRLDCTAFEMLSS